MAALHRTSALVALLLLLPSAAHAEGIGKAAKQYFENGVRLIRDPKNANYQDAYHQFRLAYKASHHNWKVLGNLGYCAMKIERDSDAIRYYTQYLAEGGKEIRDRERSEIEKDLLLMKGNLGTIKFRSAAKNVRILDKRVDSKHPVQTYQMRNGALVLGLRAGTHRISASSGSETVEWQAVINPGEELEHEFVFKDKAPLPAPVAPPPATGKPATVKPPPKEEPKNTSVGPTMRTTGYITLGVGGASLIGGLITGLMFKSKEDDALGQCRTAADGSTECPERSRATGNDAQSLATTTNILLIGGGVLAVSGLTLLLTAPSEDAPPSSATATSRKGGRAHLMLLRHPPRASIRLTPMLGPTQVGVGAFGRF